MNWETVIGLETHVELATKTKIFCSCTTAFGGEPNTHCCPVCTGMPGTLPVVNERVLEFAVKAGLALHGEITRRCKFDRKNYFYPDLPKAYQVSQLYLPIVRNGRVPIRTESGEEKVIRIHELHMEEDAGKLVHDPWIDQTRCDYNRCGVPLIEIVTEPDFRSAEEVIAYLEKLRSTLQYLGVSDCKMQEGSLRCDVNLSVRPAGSQELGTRTEMKNLNSFKAIARSIAYEARRQIVLTSDRPPKEMTALEDRLKTRFEWGLLADIQPPDFETRVAIVRRKAELMDLDMPPEVSEYIANKLKSNIRQLEGVVKKLKAYKLLVGSPTTILIAQNAIRDIFNDSQPIQVTVERIISEVGRTYGVTPDEIRSQKRTAHISTARQVSAYVIREITQASMQAIGDELGNRDHSTIVYALNQVEKEMKNNSFFRETVEDIIKNIRDN